MNSQSQIHKPEAPTAAFDLNLFSKVLLLKQSKFDNGADLIQSKISNLENTQVLGEAQKKYLSDKVNGVIEGVNGMGGLDFSDRNVINQTSGYVDTITKDPIINTAITNTRNIQKGIAYFDKLKQDVAAGKKGVYYNPANEYDYMDSVNDYLRKSKTDPAAILQEKPISPPVDVNKALMSAAKEVVASKYTERDGTNKYILKDGRIVTPARLYETALTQIQTDPNLANQIRINAKYSYLQKDANGNINLAQLQGLKATYLQSNEAKITSLQNDLVDLGKKHMAAGDKDSQVRIQSQIDDTAAELNNYMTNQSNRENEINSLLTNNPEAAAANVYTNKLLEGIVAAKAFREENVKFDQSAMFVDKLNFQVGQELFDQKMAEQNYALETAKLSLAAAKQVADGTNGKSGSVDPSGTDGIYSDALSLPTNVRKSSQETQIDQIRGVQMQQANTQQDYYHYLYQFKNSSGLVQKNGNVYQPTEAAKTMWADQMKMRQDMRDGKKIPVPLDPEFLKLANKYDDLELVKKQYENTVIDVNREALQIKRKELGMSDNDYELFLKGKAIVAQLPDKTVLTPYSTKIVTAKDFDAAPKDIQTQKAIEIYRNNSSKMTPDAKSVEKIYESKGTQILPRSFTPVGLKKSDLDARAASLKGQIESQGFYSLDGSIKPENTIGKDVLQENIAYIGDFFGDLGNGAQNYVKSEISNGLTGDKKESQTVLIPVDNTYSSNFRSFAQNVNEAARQQVLREGSLEYNSSSSDGRNVIQTKISKLGRDTNDESSALQVFITHDENGKRITPQAITIKGSQGKSISENVELAKRFADNYAEVYKQAAKINKKPSVAAYIDILNK